MIINHNKTCFALELNLQPPVYFHPKVSNAHLDESLLFSVVMQNTNELFQRQPLILVRALRKFNLILLIYEFASLSLSARIAW